MKAELSYVWWLAASVGLALALSWVMGKWKEHRETEEERQRMLARIYKSRGGQ